MKDTFYKHISDTLTARGYSSNIDKCWTIEISQRQPDQQISINGQVQVIPGRSTTVRKTVKAVGEGDVDDHEFAQLVFTVEVQDKPDDHWQVVETGLPEECIYFDDLHHFDYWVSYL